jgi:DNA polymerase-1
MKTFKQLNEIASGSLMIVDGLNLGFRYAHSKARDFAEDYMRTVESLKKSYKCDKVIITGDWGSSSYRKAIYPEYKANRTEKFKDQTDQEKEDFEAFFAEMQVVYDRYAAETKYPCIRFKGVEADDIASYICKKRKHYGVEQIWNISSDRDWLLNLAEGVSQFSYVTRKEFTVDNWNEYYEHSIEDYISIKVLQGDAGDNVFGVPGIGPKKALALVQQYGTAYDIAANLPIASKYKYIANLNEFGAEHLMLNYKLMDLVEFCEEAIGEDNVKTLDTLLKEYLN